MKRVISGLLLITLLLASVLAIVPVSAATPTEFNVMGNSDATKQFAGEGNVFYFDYHKFISLGNSFPMSEDQKGNADYMIRYPNNGSGSASVSDGVKSDSTFNHTPDEGEPVRTIGDNAYNQIFGYSFVESVVVDNVTIYLPEGTPITAIDVYGASLDGGVYAKDAEKTPLASFASVNTASATEGIIVLDAVLFEALKIDYLILGVRCTSSYKLYEIELNGIMATDAADFSALKEQYAIYKTLNEEDWTVDSWAKLKSALAITDPINKNATSTATEIASAAATLKDAINALVAKPADKTALASAITEANTLVKEDYTSASWAKFENALSAANVANGSDGLSQSEINNALNALLAAIEALELPADKSDLEATLATLDDLKESDYTPASWEALQTPIAKATAVKNNASATQDEVDEALAALNMAINALAKPGNKTALKSAITSAKALKKSDYNVAAITWNVFETCIEEAEAVVNDVNATQGEIDEILAELNNKIEGLGTPIKNNNNNNNNSSNDDEDEAVEDEDNADASQTQAPATQAPIPQATTAAPATNKKGCGSSVAVSALAVVCAIGAALVIKKKD